MAPDKDKIDMKLSPVATKGGRKMVAPEPRATLGEYRGKYRLIVSYYDVNGARRQKTKSTDLPVRGNKKQAEILLNEFAEEVTEELKEEYRRISIGEEEREFTAFLKHWLSIRHDMGDVAENTFQNYKTTVYRRICPYFDEKYPHLALRDVTASKLEGYYHFRMTHDGVSACTIKKEHSYISNAMRKAYKQDLIDRPVVDKVDLPKKERYRGSFYTREEMKKFLEAVEGDPYELPVKLAAYLGLRKSEALGLQWDSVNFEENTITIERTVVAYYDPELKKVVELEKNKTKTESSKRTLTMPTPVADFLRKARAKQFENRMANRPDYNMDQLNFVCVDDRGNRLKSECLSKVMKRIAEKAGVKRIRFHDLRHSCATLLLNNGASLKEIQVWLGHADFQTTADIYAHVCEDAMDRQARVLSEIFSFTA